MKQSAQTVPAPGSVGAVIVAAGSSSRMQGIQKQFVELEGVPVVVRAAQAFERSPLVDEIVVVCRGEDIPHLWELQRAFSLSKIRSIVAGGATRQESVFAGVRALGETPLVAVHDGARAFVTGEIIAACAACAAQHGAACAAVPVKDTIKQAGPQGEIVATPPRENLFSAQTPQIFQRGLYLRAMEAAEKAGTSFTDDCQLVEALGSAVYLSPGSGLNFKITTPEDLILAQAVSAGEID